MLRSLVRLYLVVVVCASAAILFINTSFTRFFYERISSAARETLSTYAFVLNDYLERHPGASRQPALRELAKHGNEGFGFMSIDDARKLLSAEQQRDLDRGEIAISYDGKDYFMPLVDGTVLHARPDEPPSLDIQIYAYLTVALATLLAVALWIHYHWRDLRKLEAAARAFGDGRLSTRAELSRKSNIYELSQQFNDMAERIEASIQQQREMMHGISHELKTPLARLEFGLALLSSPDAPERMRERQAALRRDVRELDELVTELLTIGRLEQGERHLALMQVMVAELIDSVAASVAHEIADRRLTLDVSARGAPACHVCDAKLVARALLNLIRNGMRYASTTISLRASLGEAGALVLSVDDDGPGIAAADRDRVFEPFHRLDSSRDRQTGGFGLGLTIVRSVALAHGGDVRLDDTPLGGARFAITLPALEAPGREQDARGAAA
ncbi:MULTISPECIES: two-component system sensor histidine kinase BprS [pseudomallei group]|uniref:histidine kinase n=3 Tax=Burkholderia mallei TaxID=13373 RepID=A2RW52_BURM9|nr:MULTISPECIES: two-component system sensor histidine kinase BprS [pseudomallei group]AAU46505.1 sensor histidine kinase [Burkholderia mallei ATCC 23344]ABN00008.1 sensor histidine kinase RstB [Burkholderia mallei NCTC 10229]ABO03432.1 sensor histidine kinase RstB [Burkholderia mallei NCTC 10247]AIO54454.1 HAMP domain protein [Burkholderia mallei]AIO56490.1 HAMP domain protein [Burkholderia mallei]